MTYLRFTESKLYLIDCGDSNDQIGRSFIIYIVTININSRQGAVSKYDGFGFNFTFNLTRVDLTDI